MDSKVNLNKTGDLHGTLQHLSTRPSTARKSMAVNKLDTSKICQQAYM